jgi:hypothetical protein
VERWFVREDAEGRIIVRVSIDVPFNFSWPMANSNI